MVLSIFEWLETTRLSVAINNSLYWFAVIQVVHLIALAVLGGAVLLVDLRLCGAGLRGQPVQAVAAAARPWLIGGVIAILVTGLVLFATLAASKYYWNEAFWLKMSYLLAALVFTFAVREPLVRSNEARALRFGKAVAAVSIFLWLGVAVMGRAIGFI